MRFTKGNNLAYGQDFTFHRGMPDGVEFDVDVVDASSSEPLVKLRAEGYGALGRGSDYGNGALYLSGREARHVLRRLAKQMSRPEPQ